MSEAKPLTPGSELSSELSSALVTVTSVYVTFMVERDGSITGARVLRDIGGGCGAAAIRVVKAMPKWTPGKQRGKPVRVQYNLPVAFILQ